MYKRQVLKGEDTSELIKFYTQDFLDRDPLLSRAPYEKFDISNYDHRIRIKMLWVWPWENKTKVKVEEIINGIEGSVKDEESDVYKRQACMKQRVYIMSLVGQKVLYRIRQDLFEHIQGLSFTFYDTRPAGKILVRIINCLLYTSRCV